MSLFSAVCKQQVFCVAVFVFYQEEESASYGREAISHFCVFSQVKKVYKNTKWKVYMETENKKKLLVATRS